MDQELRKFIWDIYQEYFKKTGETCNKLSECSLVIKYPSISDSNFNEKEFMVPILIRFYSYELGPSRWHNFMSKEHFFDNSPDYNEFMCDNLVEEFKAIVKGWLDKVLEEY